MDRLVAAFTVILVFLFFAKKRSQRTGEKVGDILYEYIYKASLRTYYIYVWAIYVLFLGAWASLKLFPNDYDNLILAVLALPIYIYGMAALWVSNWVYQDAKKRNMQAGFWGYLVYGFAFPFTLGVYLNRRKSFPSKEAVVEKPLSLGDVLITTAIWIIIGWISTLVVMFAIDPESFSALFPS